MWVKRRLMEASGCGGTQWLVFDDAGDCGPLSGTGDTLPLTEDDERKLALLMMLDTRGAVLEGVGRRSFIRNRFVLYREEDNHS